MLPYDSGESAGLARRRPGFDSPSGQALNMGLKNTTQRERVLTLYIGAVTRMSHSEELDFGVVSSRGVGVADQDGSKNLEQCSIA